MQKRVEVKFLEKVEPYDVWDIGLIMESMVISLGSKVERIEKQIVKEENKAILSPKSTKWLQRSQN